MNDNDQDYRVLAGISRGLEAEYAEQGQEWVGSPFAWIKTRPSRQVGAIGERLVAGWLAARGFNVARSGDSEADRVVENRRIEIKLSTRWANGNYKFQQLRDQRYDLVVCLGISPFAAHCWVLPKADVMRLWKVENKIPSQHGGQAGEDTAWLDVKIDSVPEWLGAYGGSLPQAIGLLSKHTGYVPRAIDESD